MLGLRLAKHLVELGEDGDLPRGGCTLATRRIRVDRSDDGGGRHSGQGRQVQRVAGVSEPDHRDAKMRAVWLIANGGCSGARLEHRSHASTGARYDGVDTKTSAFMARIGV
jgi:hypothetical protein